GDRWIMEFEEITNKTDAGKLTKGFIKARRDLLGIGEDEYLMNDLLEMQVITEEGRDIGKVMNIFETAAHEILEVESETTEAMIPNIAEFVKEIDFEKGIIRVALIDGMLEEKK
ncbi:MAG: ribosome maturation factor RimM, partial [Fusobacteriaceae bacterium]